MVIEIKTDKPYEVIVEDGVLDRAGEKIAPLVRPGSRAMIVSETNVFPIYGERLKASLEKAGIHTAEFVFEAGEPQKQLSTVMQIYEALAENDFTRSDIIVTLGGGVAGDMGGFRRQRPPSRRKRSAAGHHLHLPRRRAYGYSARY